MRLEQLDTLGMGLVQHGSTSQLFPVIRHDRFWKSPCGGDLTQDAHQLVAPISLSGAMATASWVVS